MRITIVSRIYRPEPSAASLLLGSVADALVAEGHEVTVLTAKPPRGIAVAPRGERVRTFPVLRDRSGYVRGYLQYLSFDVPLFFRLLFSRRPEAVFMEPPPTTGVVVRIVCALRRVPYVYNAADIWSDAAGHATDSGLVVRVVRAFERFAMRGARRLVAISQGVIDRVRTLGIGTPAEVVGFGADTEIFRYQENAAAEPVFLYAGTHTGLHGAGILVEAFARFSETHPGYRLRFIGNGTDQDAMRERAGELGIGAAVSFEPSIPSERLRSELSRAVASLATLLPGGGYEYAFTTKAYSSLATGCPVIFAGPGPTAVFLRAASREVPAGAAVNYDVEAIAEAMRNAADRPLSPEDRRSVATWTAAHHSMRAVAERISRAIVSSGRHRKEPS